MGRPATDAQLEQAAETVCRMAEVPGLDRGLAVFDPDLARVEWYSPQWGIDISEGLLGVEVHVPAVSSYGNRAELLERCKWEVMEGVHERERSVARMLPFRFDAQKQNGRGPGDLRELVAMLDDEVEQEQWRERIDNEWPPVTAITGGEDR